MGTYLMECYEPQDGGGARLALEQLVARSDHVDVHWGVFAPSDELSLWVVSAPSRELLVAAVAVAGIDGHVQEAVALIAPASADR